MSHRIRGLIRYSVCILKGSMRLRWIQLFLSGFLVASGVLAVSQPQGIDPSLLKKATDGNAQAQYEVGLLFHAGHGVQQDDSAAATWFKKAADQGLAGAQLNLGLLYDGGDGVPQSYPQAAGWYRKAALQGLPEAQFNLGTLYERGDGVPQDYTQAADLYRRAAEKGNASAQFNLGLLYDNGTGLERDYVQAAALYAKAAEQGLPRAQYNLASMYAGGHGVPVNLVEAYFWMDLAANTWNGTRQQEAVQARDLIAQRLTQVDLLNAQNRAAKWLAHHQK